MMAKRLWDFIDRPLSRLYIALFFCAALILGLVCSKAIMSIASIALAVNAVISRHVLSYLRIFIKDKLLLALTGLFWVFVLSGINSQNIPEYIFAVRTKLPFLLMPLAFIPLRNITARQFYSLLTFYVYVVAVTSLIVLVRGLISFDPSAIARGSIYNTPVNHVRFSLIVAFAIIAGIYSLYKRHTVFSPIEQYLRGICILFMLVFIHILAVRSGLLSLYIVAAYAALYYIFKNKTKWVAVSFLAGAAILFTLAFNYVPSLRLKWSYMQYEWSMYKNGQSADMYASDIGRWRSDVVAWHIFKEHTLWGVGIGDIDDVTYQTFHTIFPQTPYEQQFTAHNQYLFVLSTTGIIGGTVFILCLFIPAVYKRNYRHLLFMSFQIIMWWSFIFEAPLQEQVGSTFYWLFTLLIYMYIHREAYD